MNSLLEKAKKIKCVICDVDGVLTDGLIFIDNAGNELKAFNIQDGLGLKLLMSAGIQVAVITGSQNAVIDHRMQQLGIVHYFKGQINKQAAFNELKLKLNLPNEAFAYIGDDLPDLPIMKQVGFSAAVYNAVPQVKEIATWTTEHHGGRGGVRDVCDLILTAQGNFDDALQVFLAS
jgi:3-deoxy-D-manno-octulosonate 8-phosphate phosphatase (KDO 8-P phosphatase)